MMMAVHIGSRTRRWPNILPAKVASWLLIRNLHLLLPFGGLVERFATVLYLHERPKDTQRCSDIAASVGLLSWTCRL